MWKKIKALAARITGKASETKDDPEIPEEGIIHFSDLHVFDKETGDRWKAAATEIARTFDPKKWIIVISGDLTNHGSASEFDHCLDGFTVLRLYGFTVLIVGGNHDYGPWGNFYTQSAHTRFLEFSNFVSGSDVFPRAIDRGDYQILLLDSTAHGEEGQPFARGRIGSEQLAWLETQLADPRPTYIVMHHRPYWSHVFLAVTDRDSLRSLVERRTDKGQIVKYLCGHRHVEDLDVIAAGKFFDDKRVILINPATGKAVGHEIKALAG